MVHIGIENAADATITLIRLSYKPTERIIKNSGTMMACTGIAMPSSMIWNTPFTNLLRLRTMAKANGGTTISTMATTETVTIAVLMNACRNP